MPPTSLTASSPLAGPRIVAEQRRRTKDPGVATALAWEAALARRCPSDDKLSAPSLSIAFCTKDRAKRLVRLLDSLQLVKNTCRFRATEILVVDNYSAKAWIDRYEFAKDGKTTLGKAGDIPAEPFKPTDTIPPRGDHRLGVGLHFC